MTRTGHHLTGLGVGFITAALLHRFWPHSVWVAALPAAWFGGVAPDRLEYLGPFRWVAHRTLTHWGVLWLAFSGYVAWRIATAHGVPPLLDCAMAGFTAGGVSHLLGDWPNPMGVPWLLPTRRHTLGLWASGQYEWLVVPATFALAWLAWGAS
ncbi:MAG: metal-dependent hydrolase [Acidiferrobacterales bacterium]